MFCAAGERAAAGDEHPGEAAGTSPPAITIAQPASCGYTPTPFFGAGFGNCSIGTAYRWFGGMVHAVHIGRVKPRCCRKKNMLVSGTLLVKCWSVILASIKALPPRHSRICGTGIGSFYASLRLGLRHRVHSTTLKLGLESKSSMARSKTHRATGKP